MVFDDSTRDDPPAVPDAVESCGYVSVSDGEGVIYDKNNSDAWVQSDWVVQVGKDPDSGEFSDGL